MKRTGARFKYAQKVAKRNEETYRADALAANFDTGNIKGFWKCIKDYNTGQVAFSNTVHNASGPIEIASMWQQHFNELFKSVPDSNEKAKVLSYRQKDINTNEVFVTPVEIHEVISELPRNKAPGYDGLMSEHFHFASHRVKIELAIVLQAFMRHGFLPDSLMLTMIVPILKSKNGDITSKGNYRPIAIATVISNILEICIQKRLEEYLWTTDNKFAYKKGHSRDMCVFILKEMIRFYRKHRTSVYVCFLDASKAFDYVNHWKLFNVMIERKCPAFIIRLLNFWYRNQKLCIKWDSVLSEKFSVTNGIKQGGIVSPKLFNICVNTLSVSLNEKYIGCCLNGKVVNHLYYADDLVLVSPTASGMNELLQVCEHFSEKFGLKFNEQKTVLLYLMPQKLKIKPGTSVMMNDTVIKMESSCRYLGHMVTDGLDDNEDIKRQLRSFYGKANMLLRTFNYCSADVKKKQLFSSYCGSLYTCHLWWNHTVRQYRQMHVAYNNVFRRLMGYHKFCSASGMFVENRIDNFDARKKWLVYGFYQRLMCSGNSLVNYVMNSSAWLSSDVY